MNNSHISTKLIPLVLMGILCVAASASAQPDRYVVCEGVYALCDLAECEPIPKQLDGAGSPSVPPDTAICKCDVEYGLNMGPGPCEDRFGPEEGQLLSTYSLANSFDDGVERKYIRCDPAQITTPTSHTTCYGYPCQIGEDGKADCTCPIFHDQAFITLSGGCDPTVCTEGLYQGGTPTDAIALNSVFAELVNHSQSYMNYCSADGGND